MMNIPFSDIHTAGAFADLGRLARWLGVGAMVTAYGAVGVAQMSPGASDSATVPADATVPHQLPADDPVSEPSPHDAGVAKADGQARPRQDEPAESEPDAPNSADPSTAGDAQSWRIAPSEGPPIQVERAVDEIVGSAERVASEMGDDGDNDDSGADQPGVDPSARHHGRRRIIDRGQQTLSDFKRDIDFDHIRRTVGKMLTSGGKNRLVLTPYIDDPRWAEAMQLLTDDECDESLDLATQVVGPPDKQQNGEPAIRYALARIQMCASGHEAAGKHTLQKLADGDYGTVSVLARRRLGLPVDDGPTGGHSRQDFADRIGAARQLARSGKLDRALAKLDELHDDQTRGWYRYKVRSAQVRMLRRAGRLKAAARKMLGIYRITRDWNIGDAVEHRLERLQKRAGVQVLSFGERVDRMRDLIARGKYAAARKVSVDNAKRRGVGGDEIRGWGLYRRALQKERQRDRDGAAKLFKEAASLVDDDAVRPRLYFGWARALRRLDRDPEAIALYDRLRAEYPRHLLADDALFESGRLSQYLGRHRQARRRFERLVGMYPSSEFVAQSLWRGAFSAYLMDDYEAAQRPLKQIIAYYGDIQDASELTMGLKAQYWLGVARLEAGDRSAARATLQAAINRGPLTWYGRLAAARMSGAHMDPRVPIPHSTLAATDLDDLATLRVPDNPRLAVAAQYSRLGMYSEAIAELRRQVAGHPCPQRAHQFLAAAYLADGQPNDAHWMMKQYIDETGPGYYNLHDWGVAFPVAYMNLAHKYGEKFNVPPFLVEAIIRQESGFRAGVASYAGAVGLMQLMPGTARYTQRTFMNDAGGLTRASMVEPETNIRLGTMYIRIQTAFAADHIPLALAGYNAGPAPLESWFARYGDRQLDAWVESITYREARGYVRKVYTSYVTYAGLYGDGSLPTPSLDMPDELGEWGDIPEVDHVQSGEPVSMLVN